MTSGDIDQAKKQQEEVNQAFLAAVYLGRPDDAAAVVSQVDWSLFSANQNPMERVLNQALFVPRTLAEHAENNHKLVADYAAENFDYGEHSYEDDQGWEHTSHGNGRTSNWEKVIYLKPSWVEEDDDSSTSARMTIEFVQTKSPWSLDGCALTSCEVSDDSGNDYGSLPDLENAHHSAAYGVTADKMPGFVLQVMQWCLDADRPDLIAVSASSVISENAPESRAKSALTESYSNYVLCRAANLGQVEVVEAAIDLGCNPLEVLKFSDGPDRSALEIMERGQSSSSAALIRSVLAKRAATLALDEISGSAKARSGP